MNCLLTYGEGLYQAYPRFCQSYPSCTNAIVIKVLKRHEYRSRDIKPAMFSWKDHGAKLLFNISFSKFLLPFTL